MSVNEAGHITFTETKDLVKTIQGPVITGPRTATALTMMRIATSSHEEFHTLINDVVKLLWKLTGEFLFECPHCQSKFDNPIDADSHIMEYRVSVPVRGVYFK